MAALLVVQAVQAVHLLALELLANGTWSGTGVLGPECFESEPFLELLTAYGSPWGQMELPA